MLGTMGFDGTGYLLALLVTGVWLVTVCVQFALLGARRTPVTEAVCWFCIGAQVVMLVRCVQVGLLPVAAVCLVTIGVGLLARRRWSAQVASPR